MTSATPRNKKRFLRDKPSKPTVAALLLLLVTVILSRDRIGELAALRGILETDSPDPELIARVADKRHNPLRFLNDIWRSGRIPHRWDVISYISRTAVARHEIVDLTEPILFEAARDRDLSVRQAALNLARIAGHRYWIPAAIDDLDDPDDDLRLEALHTLHRGRATNALPAIVSRLDDPAPSVAEFARGVIHNFTGIDHPTIATNVATVHEWFTDRRAALPVVPIASLHHPPPGQDCAELRLESPTGRPLPLAQLRGRPVLLFFFASWAADCTLEMAALRTLKGRLGDRVHLLMIGIDHNNNSRQKHGGDISAVAAKEHVQRLAAIQRITPYLAFDPDGSALRQLEGMEIPAHILLDADLRLIRRFTGRRSADNLERIITRLAPSQRR